MSNPHFALAESVSTPDVYFIPVYILILIYCCFGLAVVCDVYFVPALQKLSATYDLPPDIAGSTLMALGASVPELFASLIGVFITEDDIGTGSIIGSSCFNLIAVPAACAFVASATFSHKVKLSAFPVLRNLSFYVITVLVLILIINDNIVSIPEALILLLFFVMYMSFMVFSAQYKSYFGNSSNNSLIDSCASSNSDIDGSLVNKFIMVYDNGHQIISMCRGNESDRIDNHYETINSINKINIRNNDDKQAKSPTTEKTPLLSKNMITSTEIARNSLLRNYNKNLVPPSEFAESQKINDDHMMTMNATTINNSLTNSCNTDVYQGAVDHSFNDHDFKYHNGSTANNLNGHADSRRSSSANAVCQIAIRANSTQLLIPNVNNDNHHDHNNNGDESGTVASHWLDSKWILIPMLPVTLSMKMLSPYKFKSTCWTIWTFLVSILLIGALTYLSVWTVHCFGKALGIPETVAGMTILSWGTGIPELIASIVLIKKTAQADMAICNTIGSNVIDISFCLSLPWIVKCFMNMSPGYEPIVRIKSSALPWSCLTLLSTVVFLVIVFKAYNWELNWKVGTWLLVIYSAFVLTATFLEYNYCETGLNLFDSLKLTPEWLSSVDGPGKLKQQISRQLLPKKN